MKKFKTLLWAMLPLFALTFVVGCTDTNEPEPGPNFEKDSTIKLNETKIDAGLAGGSYSIVYEIENAHAGE